MILISLIGVTGVTVIWFLTPRNPRPQSQYSVDRLVNGSLKQYWRALEKSSNVVPDHRTADEAIAAVRRTGDPAIKRLVDLVEAKDRSSLPPVESFYGKQTSASAEKERIYNEYYHRRSLAVLVLCELGPAASNGIPGLIRTFGDWNLGYDAERVLASIGTAAVDPLIAELRSTNIEHRVHAADALNRMGTNAAKALPELRSMMMDTNRAVRSAAIRAWGGIGYPNSEVQRELKELMMSDADAVDAVWGLVNLDGECFPAFAQALTSSNPPTRFAGLVGLRAWFQTVNLEDREGFHPRGWSSGTENPRLKSFWIHLRLCEGRVRSGLDIDEWMVASAIERLHGIESWRDHSNSEARKRAVEILGLFPRLKGRIIPVLERSIREDNEMVRIAASRSIEKLNSASGNAEP